MGPYLGDYNEDATVDFIWDSNDSAGASITRATDGTISVYKANGTSQSVAGITDTEDFDSLTGIHHLRIDLNADAFYATANDYNVVLSAATIDGQTVNAVLATFSIENRFSSAAASGLTDILNITPLIPPSVDLANTSTWRLGIMLINSLDNLPSTAEITPGTIDIDRKAIGGTSWLSIVSGSACSELAGLVYYDEVFDTTTTYVEGDSIRITFKNQKITVAANDYEISDANGRTFYTEIRETMRGTDSAALASVATEARLAELDGANLPADVDAILVDTAEIGAAGAGLSDLGGMSAGMKAEVNAEADTALSDIGLDHLISAAVSGADVTDDSIIAQMVSKSGTADWDDFINTTDSLQAIADTIASSATVAAIVDGVWDEIASGHVSAGSFGKLLGSVADAIWDEVIEAGAPANAQTARELYRILMAATVGVDGDTAEDWSAEALDTSKVRVGGSLTSDGKRSLISTLDGS